MIFYKDGTNSTTSIGIVQEQFDLDIQARIASGATWEEIIQNHFLEPVTNVQEWSHKLLTIFALWKFDEYTGGHMIRGSGRGAIRGGWTF